MLCWRIGSLKALHNFPNAKKLSLPSYSILYLALQILVHDIHTDYEINGKHTQSYSTLLEFLCTAFAVSLFLGLIRVFPNVEAPLYPHNEPKLGQNELFSEQIGIALQGFFINIPLSKLGFRILFSC